jgi:hypothetical protein
MDSNGCCFLICKQPVAKHSTRNCLHASIKVIHAFIEYEQTIYQFPPCRRKAKNKRCLLVIVVAFIAVR